jgi:chromosome segregation ATPase
LCLSDKPRHSPLTHAYQEAEVSRKQTAIEHATNDKNTLEEEKKALVDTCEGLRKQIESDKIQSDKDLRAALTREQQSHSSTATSLRKAEQEVAGFKEQLQGVRHELELAKITTTGHEQDLETKDREISSKEEQLSEKQEQIKQLRDIELAEMRRQYNQVSTEKAILVNRATAEHTELSSKHRDSQTRVAELTFDVGKFALELRLLFSILLSLLTCNTADYPFFYSNTQGSAARSRNAHQRCRIKESDATRVSEHCKQ